VDTVIRVLRLLTGVLLLAATAAPAGSSWCAAAERCGTARSEHACCQGARLTDCDCGGSTHPANDDAEPAQRVPQHTPALAAAGRIVTAVADRPAVRRLDDPVPPPGSSDRLSLLSILIV
jgi:hypothetical protein